MPNHTQIRPYFDANHLPQPQNAYVAWIDVMGIQGIMSRSLSITSNFVFKLHIAALDAPRDMIQLYPVMDGIYVVCQNRLPLVGFIEYVFSAIADTFVTTIEKWHRFIIKGAIAYGPIVHGQDVPQQASNTLTDNPSYRNSILLGMPVIQAYLSERAAPPFGLFVHESARAFSPATDQPFHNVWWEWFRQNHAPLAQELLIELEAYFEFCEKRSRAIFYDRDRIKEHREMANQYLHLSH